LSLPPEKCVKKSFLEYFPIRFREFDQETQIDLWDVEIWKVRACWEYCLDDEMRS